MSMNIKEKIELHKKWINKEPGGIKLDLSNMNLSYHVFRHCDLREANLSGADLSHTNLSHALLTNADLSHSDLRYADLNNVKAANANFIGANANHCYMDRASITHSNLSHANFNFACAPHADFNGSNFSWSNLTGSTLCTSSLNGTNFTQANIKNSNLNNVQIKDAIFHKAMLRGSAFSMDCLMIPEFRSADFGKVPKIKNIHQTVYQAASVPGALDMTRWHCGTSHCRAGWVVTLAGASGRKLEQSFGAARAAALIYFASDPNLKVIPDFYDGNVTALNDMKRMAEAEKKEQSNGKNNI